MAIATASLSGSIFTQVTHYDAFTSYQGENIRMTIHDNMTIVSAHTGRAWFNFAFGEQMPIGDIHALGELIDDAVTFEFHTGRRLSKIREFSKLLQKQYGSYQMTTFFEGYEQDDAVIEVYNIWG